MNIPTLQIDLPLDKITEFCQRWQITELALFGSVLRDDFRPDSDVDVLVTFAPDMKLSLANWLTMIDELEEIFGRTVDFMQRSTIQRSDNYILRKAILSSAQTIYAT